MGTSRNIKVISIKQNPEYRVIAIEYIKNKWATNDSIMVYDDCIEHCITTSSPLPQWYLLEDNDNIIGCAGLITNDFISRMDLYPWLCCLYVEKLYRGHAYGSILIDKIKSDTHDLGFDRLYLCTDHIGYYEKYGFKHIGEGYHPWGEISRIYEAVL